MISGGQMRLQYDNLLQKKVVLSMLIFSMSLNFNPASTQVNAADTTANCSTLKTKFISSYNNLVADNDSGPAAHTAFSKTWAEAQVKLPELSLFRDKKQQSDIQGEIRLAAVRYSKALEDAMNGFTAYLNGGCESDQAAVTNTADQLKTELNTYNQLRINGEATSPIHGAHYEEDEPKAVTKLSELMPKITLVIPTKAGESNSTSTNCNAILNEVSQVITTTSAALDNAESQISVLKSKNKQEARNALTTANTGVLKVHELLQKADQAGCDKDLFAKYSSDRGNLLSRLNAIETELDLAETSILGTVANAIDTDKDSCAACKRAADKEGGLFMGSTYKFMCCMMVDFQNIVIKFFGWLTSLMLYFIQNV